MTDAPKISLGQQAEAVNFALVRARSLYGGSTIREMRPRKEAEFDLQRLAAAVATLRWLREHEADVRWFLRLPAEARQVLKDATKEAVIRSAGQS